MDILLIAGLWLDGSIWGDVVAALEERSATGRSPLTLPGQGDGSASATLDDQLAAVLAAVDAAAECADGRRALGGQHPGVAGRRRPPGAGRQGRLSSAASRMPTGEPTPTSSRSSDGVDAVPRLGAVRGGGLLPTSTRRSRRGIAARRDPGARRCEPRAVVRLSDERRYDVPVVLVCPEFTPAAGAGVDRRRRASPSSPRRSDSSSWTSTPATGRWSRAPAELARVLAAAATSSP